MCKCNVSIVLRPCSSCSHPVPGRFSWRSWTSRRQWLRPQCQRQRWRCSYDFLWGLCQNSWPGGHLGTSNQWPTHWLFQTSIQTSKGWSWHWQRHAQIKGWVTPWESLYWGMNMLLCVCMDLLCCSAEVLRVLCMVASILYDIFPYFSLACSTQLDMAHKMRYVPLRCTFSIPMSHRVTVQACTHPVSLLCDQAFEVSINGPAEISRSRPDRITLEVSRAGRSVTCTTWTPRKIALLLSWIFDSWAHHDRGWRPAKIAHEYAWIMIDRWFDFFWPSVSQCFTMFHNVSQCFTWVHTVWPCLMVKTQHTNGAVGLTGLAHRPWESLRLAPTPLRT